MAEIHPTAIVEKGAELADGVAVGPYCVIGPHVALAEGVKLQSHVVVSGITSIGPNTHVYPFASIGTQPQDLKYKGEPSKLVIGANNIVREHVTMNPGTEGGGMLTEVGNNCLFMMSSHVAHDCHIANHVIMANHATLGGHVSIGEWAILGGLSAVHQFVRIGQHAMVGGMSGVEQDVIPYGSVMGNRARLAGLDVGYAVGLYAGSQTISASIGVATDQIERLGLATLRADGDGRRTLVLTPRGRRLGGAVTVELLA